MKLATYNFYNRIASNLIKYLVYHHEHEIYFCNTTLTITNHGYIITSRNMYKSLDKNLRAFSRLINN